MRSSHQLPRLDSIAETLNAFAFGAMLATKESAGLLQAMPDDSDSAMIAGWRERMNGAFEAIIGMRLAAHRDLKRLVVVIAAGFTCSHECPPSPICCRCILKSANGIRFQQRRLPNLGQMKREIKGNSKCDAHASTNSKQRRIGMLTYIGRRSYVGYFSVSDALYLGSRRHFC